MARRWRRQAFAAAVCPFPTIKDAVDTVITTIQSGVPVARIELLDEVQMRAVIAYSKLDYAVAPTLFFEFPGTEAGVAEQAEMVSAIAAEFGGTGASIQRWRMARKVMPPLHPPA
ncbi:hypothetical protein N825_05205 [Skermanella stibiiresistens SB22]|uniref:FAD-binding oxidoreductase/transferase type 4 C-terminal domain-containing protein n=1 Tax=Skermanella stibiiresistens SB22 TaxID=1385369 RepID=W9GSN0_9PROT|nr:hypothetical protein N825_05205 [Skermanella stibiiresistens SB22]